MRSVGETFHFNASEAHTSDPGLEASTAEATIDVAPEESIEIEATIPPQEAAPLSDEDIFALMLNKGEAERQENIRDNTERLISYYGDQQFQYGTHSGTITTILNVCPPIKGLLANANGFDAIADWIEPFKVVEGQKTEDDKDKDKDADQEDSKEDTLKNTQVDERNETKADKKTDEKQAAEGASKKANEQETPKAEKEIDKKDAPEVVPVSTPQETHAKADKADEKIVEADTAETTVDSRDTQQQAEVSSEKNEPREPQVVKEVVAAVEAEPTPIVKTGDEVGTYTIPQETFTPEAKEPVETETIEEEPEAIPPVAAATILETALQNERQEAEPEADSDTSTDETPIEVASFEQQEADETELPVEHADAQDTPEQNDDTPFDDEAPILQKTLEPEEEIETSSEALSTSPVETLAEIEPEETPSDTHIERIEHDFIEAPIELPQSELLQTWRKLGEEEAPLDVALTTIIEHVEHVARDTNDETTALESSERSQEGTEEPLAFTNPELRYTLEKVHRARRSIEQLQHATTKEECEQHVAAIIEEITQLLTLLGYETPTKIIQDFLADHSVQSLRELLEYLEAILNQAIERDTQSRQSTSQVKHTSLLAKLALQLVQTFAPQQTASYGERLSS